MASLPPGTLLGFQERYVVVRELNRGGTAVVYEAVDRQACRSVALKVMDQKGNTAAVKAAERELQCAARLRHRHIVQLLDFFSQALDGAQLLVIVWELVDGMDLLDQLNTQGGRLREEVAAGYFLQLVRGVSFIHAKGMTHRDLKPENVMCRGDGTLCIIDFGLSKSQQSAVTLGVGTPDYLPPEMLGTGDLSVLRSRTTGRYDPSATDCWSMGVLLYLIVVGYYPFEDPVQQQNVLLTLQNIRAGRYRQIPASVSPACRDLITRLLLLDPAARITLPEVLAHPFLAAAVAQEAAPPAQAPAQAVVEAAGEVEAAAGEAATIPAFCHAEQRPGFAFPLCHGPELHKPTPQFIDLAAAAAAAAAAEAAAAKAASAGTRPEEAAKPRAGSGFLNFCSFWGIGSCRTHE